MQIVYIGKHLKMFNVNTHTHTYGELVYCTKGKGSFVEKDGTAHYYKEGEAVFIPIGLEHKNLSEEGFSNVFVAVNASGFSQSIVKVCDNENRDILSVLNQIFYCFNGNLPHRDELLSQLTKLLFMYILSFNGSTRLSPITEKITGEIIKNFSDSEFTTTQTLDKLSMNREYAQKLFRKEKGISPAQYLTHMRIEHAKQLLNARGVYGLSIKDIAHACGYSDALYFSRVFKKHTGKSPLEY